MNLVNPRFSQNAILKIGRQQDRTFSNWCGAYGVKYEYYPAESDASHVPADHPIYIQETVAVMVPDAITGGVHVFYKADYNQQGSSNEDFAFMTSFWDRVNVESPEQPADQNLQTYELTENEAAAAFQEKLAEMASDARRKNHKEAHLNQG